MNLSFLFGSGISRPAGFPDVDEITKSVFFGKDDIPNWNNYGREKTDRIKKFIQVIKEDFKDHYSFINRDINYEDIYYLVDSIYQDENQNFENPIVYFYTKHFEQTYRQLLAPLDSLIPEKERMIDLASYAKDYISEKVTALLSKEPERLNHLDFIRDIKNDSSIDNINIFSLNHDLLLERYFKYIKISFSDGFNSKLIWDGIFEERIKLFKLHGSIDWFADDIVDSYKSNIHKNRKRDNTTPILLIGSFNKLPEYTRGLNFRFQVLFDNYLNESNYLVISGYGFADQGINSRIFSWLYSSINNRIILIHNNVESLKKSARPAISDIIDDWIIKGIVIHIPKFIEEITWLEIKEKMDGIK
jgi:hypothetical protein